MNLDALLCSSFWAGFDEEEQADFVRQSQIKQQQHLQRRKMIQLPNGRTVFHCINQRGVRFCEKAIASTEIHDGRERFKIMLRGKAEDTGDIRENLGGRCPQCEIVHSFQFEEVAQVLDFPDSFTALQTRLREGQLLTSDPEALAAALLAGFVQRLDNRWQSREEIEAEQKELTRYGTFTWRVTGDDENDPFADE